jgi:hypothetical protein
MFSILLYANSVSALPDARPLSYLKKALLLICVLVKYFCGYLILATCVISG